MSKSIYNLEEEYIQIAQQLEYGEFTPELETALAINKEQLEVKVAKYGYVCKTFDNEIEGIDKEIKRLQALKLAKENAIERLKEAVKGAMDLVGITQIKSQNLSIFFKPTSAVQITDESLIPKKYKQKKITYTVMKKEIKNDLDAGKKVKGARIDNNKTVQFR